MKNFIWNNNIEKWAYMERFLIDDERSLCVNMCSKTSWMSWSTSKTWKLTIFDRRFCLKRQYNKYNNKKKLKNFANKTILQNKKKKLFSTFFFCKILVREKKNVFGRNFKQKKTYFWWFLSKICQNRAKISCVP